MPSFTDRAWSPYVAGIVIGLLQIPAFLIIETALGASSSYVTVGALIAAWFDPAILDIGYAANHVAATAKNWWQVEVYITTVHLASVRLVPEAAIGNLARNSGTVLTQEDGRLQRRQVGLGHRLLDGRYEIVDGLAETSVPVIGLVGGMRVGRAAAVQRP